jgi:hypothetical protein
MSNIQVAGFHAKEGMENTITRWIGNICQLQTAFTVNINNYSGIPPHTIFFRVQDPVPFMQLAMRLKILDGFIQSNECPAIHIYRRPHVVLAEGLAENDYNNALKRYAQKTFFSSFKATKVTLVKKLWHGRRYDTVDIFNLTSHLRTG